MKWGSIETMFWGVSIFERDVGSSEHSNHFEFRTCWINTLTKERICKTILLLVCFNGTELNTSAGPQNLIPKVTTQRNIYTQQKTKVRRKKVRMGGKCLQISPVTLSTVKYFRAKLGSQFTAHCHNSFSCSHSVLNHYSKSWLISFKLIYLILIYFLNFIFDIPFEYFFVIFEKIESTNHSPQPSLR